MSRTNPDIDPDEVIRRARLLGQVQPTADEVQRAIGRARDLITNHTRAHRPVGRLLMKIGIPATLAAAAAVVVAIMLMSGPAVREATAAEKFEQVLKESGSYKGWVHVTQTVTYKPRPTTSSAPTDATPAADDRPTAAEVHVHTVDNTVASVSRHGSEIEVMYISVKDNESLRYSSKTNVLEKGIMSRQDALAMTQMTQMMSSPASLIEVLRKNIEGTITVKHSTKDKLDQFTITFKHPKGTPELNRFEEFVVLSDPTSKLIQEIIVTYASGSLIHSKFTYGPPEIKDIYSLKVPPDARVVDHTPASMPPSGGALTQPAVDPHAKVVDNRPSSEAQNLMKRLEDRVQKGLGDGVAVLTQVPLENGKLSTNRGWLRLYLLAGEDACTTHYLVGANTGKFPASPAKLPDGWPRPNAKDVLAATQGATPLEYFLRLNGETWRGDYDFNTRKYSMERLFTTSPVVLWWRAEQTVAGQIWPSPDDRYWLSTGAKAEILNEKDHPSQQGLRVTTFSEESQGVLQRHDDIWWFDTAKSDMPLEHTSISVSREGKETVGTTTKYLEYAKLPDGKEYPTRWQTTWPSTNKTYEYNLQIFQGMKVDKGRFARPTPPTTTSVPAAAAAQDIGQPAVDPHAKIVDNRPSPEAQKFMNRLEDHVRKGLGDGVAVLTETSLKDGKLDTDRRTLHVHLRNGENVFSTDYPLGKRDIGQVLLPGGLPKGWPRPDAKDVLGATRGVIPSRYYLKRGDKAWTGFYDCTYKTPTFQTSSIKFLSWQASITVAGQIWPDPEATGWQYVDAKVQMLTDKNRPGQQGVLVKDFYYESNEVRPPHETTWWFDSAKNDVPTECIERRFGTDGKTVTSESHKKYLEYAQLPDGRWYPTRWQEASTYTYPGRVPVSGATEYNLQIFQGMKVGEDRFVKLTPPTTTSAPAAK